MEKKGRERRLSPRFNASLPCSVSLPAEDEDLLFPQAKLAGRTRDISESGLGLVVPSIYIGFACIVDEGRTLDTVLELPTGLVELKTTAVHYIRLDEQGQDAAYLIGARITDLTEADRALYLGYLASLDKSDQT
jgi:hypothetical protein